MSAAQQEETSQLTDLMSDIRGGGDEKLISDRHSEQDQKKQTNETKGKSSKKKKKLTGDVMSQRFTQAHRFGSEGHSDRSDFQLRNPAHPSASHSVPSTGSNMQQHAVCEDHRTRAGSKLQNCIYASVHIVITRNK